MKVSVTVTSQPPPHLVNHGCDVTRRHSEVSLEAIPEAACNALCEAVWDAYRSGLFDAGGCVNLIVQRAPIPVSE